MRIYRLTLVPLLLLGLGGTAAAAPPEPPRLCPPALPAAPPAPLEAPGAAVAARAVDGESGRPVAGALSWDPARPGLVARADGRGELLAPRPAANGRLCVAAPGFVAAEQAVPALAETGGAPYRLRLLLWPARRVHGRVVGADRRPLPAARVHLVVPLPLAGSAGEIRAALPAEAATGPDGSFDLVWAAAERARLAVRAPGYAPAAIEFERRRAADLGEIALAPLAALSGEVRDGAGRPVPGAAVSAVAAGGEETVASTGPRGEFTLAGLAPGDRLTLSVTKGGFSPAVLSGVAVPRAHPLAIELRRALRLRGVVMDEDGEPVAGARVVALALPGRQGDQDGAFPAIGRPVAQAAAGEGGGFVFGGLPPGPLRLVASASGFLPAAREVDLAEADAGDPVALTLSRGATVEGRVLTAAGEPAAGARVTLDGAGRELGAETPQAVAGEDGAYRLAGVPAGEAAVRAEWRGVPPAVAPLAVQAGVNPLDITLRDGFEVAGRVATAAGEPVAGAELALVPLDTPAAPPPPLASGEDGGFRWESVAAGRYRLRGEKPGYGGEPLEVAVDGGPVAGIELRMDAGGALAGRIAGLAPGEAERVEVRASAPERRDRIATPGADGRYRLVDLGPGAWTVVAQLAGSSRAARGVAVVPPGGEAALDLALGGGLTLGGVVAHGGAPVAGAWVTVWGNGGSGVIASVPTGADGHFRLEGLAPGPYEVAVVHQASGLSRRVTLALDQDLDLPLDLPGAPAKAAAATPMP